MSPLRLCVAYDGTDFSGFQVQPDRRTVQGVLEQALGELAGTKVRVRGSGRTDAGVHALGQVASVADAGPLDADMVMRALAPRLPRDVAVVDAQPAAPGFDARLSAVSRSYAYLLWCADAPHPLYAKYTAWPRGTVDPLALSRALRTVVGTHDFSSFARVREDQSPVRTVRAASVATDGPFVRIRIEADSFLHQMVRSIVGTALEVATGRRPVTFMRDALEARDRSAAGPVAPAQGLTLVDVSYPDVPEPITWPRRPEVMWPWSDVAYASARRGCA